MTSMWARTAGSGTTIGYDRDEDAKRYYVVDLDPDQDGNPQWLTVIPKDRHYQKLELPKSIETHEPHV